MAEKQDIELEDVGELEAVEQTLEQPEQTAAPEPEDDLPPQFRGKSPSEIAKYALAQEKALSKQGNELGEVRRLADELLRSQLMATKQEPEKPKEVDFFENPQEAVRRAVESNPEVQMAKQYAIQAQQNMARNKLAELHPDFQQIMGDKEFTDWAVASPVRKDLLIRADQQYDVAAANELFSTFKELRAAKAATMSEADKTARDSAMKAAAVDSGGSGSVS